MEEKQKQNVKACFYVNNKHPPLAKAKKRKKRKGTGAVIVVCYVFSSFSLFFISKDAIDCAESFLLLHYAKVDATKSQKISEKWLVISLFLIPCHIF